MDGRRAQEDREHGVRKGTPGGTRGGSCLAGRVGFRRPAGVQSTAEAGEAGGWPGLWGVVQGAPGEAEGRWTQPRVGSTRRSPGLRSPRAEQQDREGRGPLRPPSGAPRLFPEPETCGAREQAGPGLLTPGSGRVWKGPRGWFCLSPAPPHRRAGSQPPPPPPPPAPHVSASLFPFLRRDYSSG